MKISAAPRRFDRGGVDVLHADHGIECAVCFIAAGRQRLCQHARRDLPGDAPLVLAPAARTLLASIADNSVPLAVVLLLIIGGDLKRESFCHLEGGTAVKTDAGDAGDCEFYRQHVALLAGWIITGCTVDDTHGAVGKGFGVESGQQPLRPYCTTGKSCSWPLLVLSLGLRAVRGPLSMLGRFPRLPRERRLPSLQSVRLPRPLSRSENGSQSV